MLTNSQPTLMLPVWGPQPVMQRSQVRCRPRIDHMGITGDFDKSGFGERVRMKALLE